VISVNAQQTLKIGVVVGVGVVRIDLPAFLFRTLSISR
jgi:hypothetical protein